jgi:hypothetical protein
MPEMIRSGKLFMALPPLYRLSAGGRIEYARDDAHKDELIKTVFKGKTPEIGRFKGLGEMMPAQLKETTMDPSRRQLARVTLPEPRRHRGHGRDPDGPQSPSSASASSRTTPSSSTTSWTCRGAAGRPRPSTSSG